ncbi:MAG: HAD family phosphatase [Kineosporiaceae bacterium]|nr:HAD family phosphatase [Kineosporiaceae bacterium]
MNPDLQALVLDWGGVLTPALDHAMGRWAQEEGVDFDHFREVMRGWLESGDSPTHHLERGTLAEAEFERLLAHELTVRGSAVDADGLLTRLLAGLAHLDPRMLQAIRAARLAGVRTALLSNSWGENYPDALWEDLFDVVVISGRVGMRKPDPEIFTHTAAILGVPPRGCVMVDDIERNVEGARACGMVAVHHRTVEETLAVLEELLGISLS